MRTDLDIFQMDAGLIHGITEYASMIDEMENKGYSLKFAYHHGGKLMGFYIVAGLGLSGCEVYPVVFQPMGGFQDGAMIEDGLATIPDLLGLGFEKRSA